MGLLRLLQSVFLLGVLVFFTHVTVMAQFSGATTGTITGTVKDIDGKVLVGATIEAIQIETNLKRTVQLNEKGFYHLLQLPPGTYKIKAELLDFELKEENLVLTIGTTAIIDFELRAKGTSEVIEISADNLVVSDKTESSTQFRRQDIEALPINQRNFLQFATLAPRVVISRTPEASVAISLLISINNQPSRFNNVTIDGLSNNDASVGNVRSTFSQDAVQEFQVITDNYSAEFGRALSGVINIVTRGGTNKFKGSLFGLGRTKQTSARNVFFTFSPPFERYQFGSNLSGPIKTDKAFFFVGFERFTQSRSLQITIPDLLIDAAKRRGFPINNGFIPVSVANTYVFARADYRVTENNSLWLRYNSDSNYNGEFDGFGGKSDLTNGGFLVLDNQAIAVNNTYVNPNKSLVNETRFLYTNLDTNILPYGNGPRVALSSPEGDALIGRSRLLPQPRQDSIYQFVNIVSLVKGRNQIKFGADFIYTKSTGEISFFSQGSTSFVDLDFTALSGIPNLPKFTSLQAFDPSLRTAEQKAFVTFLSTALPAMFPGFPQNLDLSDFSLPIFFTQGFGPGEIKTPAKQFSAFFQDDFKLKSNLVLKAGLRYDLNRITGSIKNNGNFSPRLSVSYRPISKLNVKAAYGLFFAAPLTGPTSVVNNFKDDRYSILTLVFPFSLIPFSLPNRRFPETSKPPAPFSEVPQLSVDFVFQPNLRSSYTQQAKLGFEYLLNNSTKIFADYTFIRGLKLFAAREINPVINPTSDPLTSQLTGRIDPSKGSIVEYESAYDSYYNAATFGIERNFSQGVSLFAHYTFSKAIDNFIDFTNTDISPMIPSNDRGLSLQDARSTFVFSGVWRSQSKNLWIRNLQISSIMNFTSGRPYNLITDDLNRDGVPGDRPLGLGRNVGITPGFASVDVRLSRSFNLSDTIKLETLVELFNFPNRVNVFTGADETFVPDAQGNFNLPAKRGGRFILPPERRLQAADPRQVQFGFRLSF